MSITYNDSSMGEITIGNWENFRANNSATETLLNTCSNNAKDIVANSNEIDEVISNVNASLKQLKKVSMDEIDHPVKVKETSNKLSYTIETKSLSILAGLRYAEIAISAFNKGESVDKSTVDFLRYILEKCRSNFDIKGMSYVDLPSNLLNKEYISELSEKDIDLMKRVLKSDGFWLWDIILKRTGASEYGSILAYVNDYYEDGGDVTIGDNFVKMIDFDGVKIFSQFKDVALEKVLFGSVAVLFFNLGVDVINHKGDWDNHDVRRVLSDPVFSALSYSEWGLITQKLFADVAGPTIGGVAVAGVLALPTAFVCKKATEYFCGDNIVDTFVRDGITYEIPANGNGPKGKFVYLTDKYDSMQHNYYIDGRLVSDQEYKKKMYSDLENFIYEDTNEKFGEIGSEYFAGETLQKALDEMAKARSYDDGVNVLYSCLEDEIMGFEAETLLDKLMTEYRFNLEEYYMYNHGGVNDVRDA